MEAQAGIASNSSAPRLRDQLRLAVARLAHAGIDSPRLDAEVLLADCLKLSRAQLLVAGDIRLDSQVTQRFQSLLARRLEREPVAYITGKQEFWSLDFTVTPEVLIPRPDTERLVEVALLWAAHHAVRQPLRIADLCTGSGAVAVSLAAELPMAQIYATDIAAAALQIARGNAEAHQVARQVQFLIGDLFDALPTRLTAGLDLIVCNPPYIRKRDIATLAPEVSRWEPRQALDGGVDGLDFYRRIIVQAPNFLAASGALALEIGADMAAEVSALCAASRSFHEIEIFQDYAGKDRVVLAQLGKN